MKKIFILCLLLVALNLKSCSAIHIGWRWDKNGQNNYHNGLCNPNYWQTNCGNCGCNETTIIIER